MRCVNLEEKVTVEFYDQEHEEWGLKEATIEDVLDSVCSTQYTEIEAEPVKHGMWLPLTMSEATGYDPTLSGDDPVMTHYCSYCSTECYADENGEDILSVYCPRCGAKMDERSEE